VQTLIRKARVGTLCDDVLQVEELKAPPELKLLTRLCISADPAQRPTAARLIAGLQHCRQNLPDR
jgi:hypothetical protein